MSAWYAKEAQAVFDELQSSEGGLSVSESARRLVEDGLNALPEAKVEGTFVTFFRQFQSPLIYILLAAAATVFLLGEVVDAIIISAVLLFNAIIGTVQEGRAKNTLRALRQYVKTSATVVRNGEEFVIPDREVVRGDILVLREGERVPADARVLSAHNLKMDEAALTGESEPVSKITETIEGEALSAPEQHNMAFKGTHIVSGDGRAVVTETGSRSVIGVIAKTISAIDTEMPLKESIRLLSRAIIIAVAVISAGIFALGLVREEAIVTIFTTVVSLAVSIIPEGLPIVITLVLATGVWRMSKRNALVKKLQAIEALGQARVIAVDKTGTITKNELVIREVWVGGKTFSVGGVGYEPTGIITRGDAATHDDHELAFVGRVAALSAAARVFFSDAEKRWKVTGDPTEAAIRIFGEKAGFKQDELLREAPQITEIPFEYHLKYRAVLNAVNGRPFLVVSGAPEAILSLSTHIWREGKDSPLQKEERQDLEEKFIELSRRGLRVVACAVREHFPETLTPDSVKNLAFVAFFGMQDALRPEVADAMARAEAAGIKVVMITGDHKLTAQAIAKEAGIWREGDEVLTGTDIETLFDPELASRVGKVSVFARVTPEHKLRIINAYRSRGEIVAMTGDGVNDAPSLVAADLGVAMGNIGTEVAKEAADIVLLDDNFGTIISAVEEGRSIYKTIKKVVLYLFSTSAGEVLTISAALVIGLPLPLLAVQIIWLNLVTDGFLVAALAMDPKEKGLLSGLFKKPKKYFVDSLMTRRIALMSIPMAAITLVLFSLYVETGLEKAWTVSLTTLAVFQWFNAWNCRSEGESVFRSGLFTNKFLFGATLFIIFLQLVAIYNPFFQNILHTVPLSLSEWGLIVSVAASIIVIEEIRKFFFRLRNRVTVSA